MIDPRTNCSLMMFLIPFALIVLYKTMDSQSTKQLFISFEYTKKTFHISFNIFPILSLLRNR